MEKPKGTPDTSHNADSIKFQKKTKKKHCLRKHPRARIIFDRSDPRAHPQPGRMMSMV